MSNRHCAIYRESDIFNHLSGIDFNDEHALLTLSGSGNLLLGERPQRDGAEQAYLQAFFLGKLHGFLGDAGGTAEGHDHVVVVLVEVGGLEAHLVVANLLVLLLQMQVALLHHLRGELERRDDIGLAVLRAAGGSPGALLQDFFLGATGLERRQHHLLHHLSYDTVGKNHGGVAIFECELEGQVDEVGHLLHAVRGERDDVVVAITTAARSLEIVALRGLDGTQSGAATLHVYKHARQLGTSHVGNAFLHQGNTRRRRRGKHLLTCTGTAVDHVDGCHLALGLQHHHAGGLPRLQLGERLNHFTLRSDRIAEISVSTATNGCMGYRLIAFHQYNFFFCHLYSTFFL